MLQTVDVHVATLTGWGESIQLHLASCKLSLGKRQEAWSSGSSCS